LHTKQCDKTLWTNLGVWFWQVHNANQNSSRRLWPPNEKHSIGARVILSKKFILPGYNLWHTLVAVNPVAQVFVEAATGDAQISKWIGFGRLYLTVLAISDQNIVDGNISA